MTVKGLFALYRKINFWIKSSTASWNEETIPSTIQALISGYFLAHKEHPDPCLDGSKARPPSPAPEEQQLPWGPRGHSHTHKGGIFQPGWFCDSVTITGNCLVSSFEPLTAALPQGQQRQPTKHRWSWADTQGADWNSSMDSPGLQACPGQGHSATHHGRHLSVLRGTSPAPAGHSAITHGLSCLWPQSQTFLPQHLFHQLEECSAWDDNLPWILQCLHFLKHS